MEQRQRALGRLRSKKSLTRLAVSTGLFVCLFCFVLFCFVLFCFVLFCFQGNSIFIFVSMNYSVNSLLGKNMGFTFFTEIKGEEFFDEKMEEADEVRKLSK